MIIINRGKIKSTDRIELPTGEKIRETKEAGYNYLRILEYDKIKEQEMKDSRMSIEGGKIDIEK